MDNFLNNVDISNDCNTKTIVIPRAVLAITINLCAAGHAELHPADLDLPGAHGERGGGAAVNGAPPGRQLPEGLRGHHQQALPAGVLRGRRG